MAAVSDKATELANATGRGAQSLAEIPEEVLVARYGTTRAEVEAIKNALAPPGTSDFEMMLYLGVCKRLGLDPFVPGLVHFARFEKTERRVNQQSGAVEYVVVGWRTGIILGVYGYLEMAQQQKDCDGFAVKSYPVDLNAAPEYATCTIWKKNWSHPLEVMVTFKEKNQNRSKFWRESPRQALETAAIRRACRLAWPALFGAMDEGDDDDGIPPAARGKVGTVLGEHHDVPIAAARVLPPSDAPLPAPPILPPPPIETPAASPAPVPQSKVEDVAREIQELMDDPGADTHVKGRLYELLNQRLDARELASTWVAKPEDYDFICALRDDLRRISGSG